MVRHAFRRLGSLHEAEDAAQQVFERAYTDGCRRKTITHVSAYLYRMVSNHCTDLLRRRKRPSASLEQAEVSQVTTTHQDGSQAVAAAEELQRIESLLRRIPRRQAEVIRLRVFDELRLAEIAEVLCCPLATVKSRLRYGLEKLREIVLEERKVS